MIERLPTPWGLVRLGVAPDHPQLKTVSRAFEKIAARPGFRFLGNVEVGRDVTHERAGLAVRRGDLRRRLADRPAARHSRRGPRAAPGPRPSSSPGTTATPTSRTSQFDLSHERAVVVGQRQRRARRRADARADAARSSHRPTRPTRRSRRSSRRGSARSSCSAAAGPCRPRGRRPSSRSSASSPAPTSSSIRPSSSSIPASEAELEAASNIVQRNVEILREFATREPSGKPRVVRLRFRVSPVAILGEERVEAVEIVHNRLEPDESGRVRAVATDEREVIPCGIVFRSVGYHGVGVPGTPFDERAGTMPNAGGRVLAERRLADPGPLLRGLDQARPDRRHRHEQEGRDRDGASSCSRTREPATSRAFGREHRRRSSPSEACRS